MTTLSPPPALDRSVEDTSLWARVARLVVDHPVRVLALALAIVLPPLLALPSMRLTHDTLADLPAGAPSAAGFDALTEHFPPGEASPLTVVIDDDEPVTEPASLRAIGDLSRNLKRLDGVDSVRSVAMPTNGAPPDTAGAGDAAARIGDLQDQLQAAADGAGRLADGASRLHDGLATIATRLPELEAGLGEAATGTTQLRAGVRRLREGVAELRAGVGQLTAGLDELRGGLSEARDGARQLRTEVAEPAEEAIREAWDALTDFTVGTADPQFERAARATGEAYGRITGEDPRTGQAVRPGYDGLAASLRELESGLQAAVDGTGELRSGAVRLDAGLGQLDDGLARLGDGLRQLDDGLAAAAPGVAELRTGVDRLEDGAARLEDGAAELRRGLATGAAELQETGIEQLVPGLAEDTGPFVITPALLQALPEIRDQLDLFLADDDTRTRVFVGLAVSPFSPDALHVVDRVQEVAELSLNGSPLEDATVAPTGVSAFFNDVDTAVARDFRLIIVAVIVGVFLVLVALLRAVVAPLYMVLTVLLSFASALGIATLVFQGLLGEVGLAWWMPPFLYVLLVALGADYNIYLMSRVREEAERLPTRQAVAEGTRLTGGVITSAGLILAGSFAALMAADLTSLQQMGFATTVGILLDTFVVRTFLVPSIAVLLGRFNWWPSARSRRA